MKSSLSVAERIKANVVVDASSCWVWQARLDADGYGHIQIQRRDRIAHRVSYEAFVGPIPEGLQIDHLCRVRACCNPEHLEAVTSRVNTLRGKGVSALNAVKTHCLNGHPLSGENLMLRADRPVRNCRECSRVRFRRYYHERKLRKEIENNDFGSNNS